jgi:tetratricopeptide (TPR) repeat protein
LTLASQAEDHEAKNEYKEAIASWTAALEADPRSEARIRYKRGNCYRACDQFVGL